MAKLRRNRAPVAEQNLSWNRQRYAEKGSRQTTIPSPPRPPRPAADGEDELPGPANRRTLRRASHRPAHASPGQGEQPFGMVEPEEPAARCAPERQPRDSPARAVGIAPAPRRRASHLAVRLAGDPRPGRRRPARPDTRASARVISAARASQRRPAEGAPLRAPGSTSCRTRLRRYRRSRFDSSSRNGTPGRREPLDQLPVRAVDQRPDNRPRRAGMPPRPSVPAPRRRFSSTRLRLVVPRVADRHVTWRRPARSPRSKNS